MGPIAGTVSRTARVSVVRLNLKEAAGKTPGVKLEDVRLRLQNNN